MHPPPPHPQAPAASPEPGAQAAPAPGSEPLQAHAFPPLVRVLAVLWTLALAVLAALSWPDAQAAGLRRDALLMLVACGALILLGAWWIVRSRTRFDGQTIEQTWMWRKRLSVQDVSQLKLVALAGLDALIAPRLVARTRSPGVVVIHCADRRVLEAFAQQWMDDMARRMRAP